MGMLSRLVCKNCSWKSSSFPTGIGRNFPADEHALCEEIEKSTAPELAGDSKAIADHSDAFAVTSGSFFQCRSCHRIKG